MHVTSMMWQSHTCVYPCVVFSIASHSPSSPPGGWGGRSIGGLQLISSHPCGLLTNASSAYDLLVQVIIKLHARLPSTIVNTAKSDFAPYNYFSIFGLQVPYGERLVEDAFRSKVNAVALGFMRGVLGPKLSDLQQQGLLAPHLQKVRLDACLPTSRSCTWIVAFPFTEAAISCLHPQLRRCAYMPASPVGCPTSIKRA